MYFRILFSLFLISFLSFPASATIFVVAYDEATGAMGTAVSSSGPAYFHHKRIQVRKHGVGIANAGGMGHCRRATPLKFLMQGLPAQIIAESIAGQCDRVEPYYRLAIVTANGDVYAHQGPNDCNKRNVHCAKIQGHQLAITGGGLEEGVAEAGFRHFESLSASIPLECRLLDTLKAIYAAGGEVINFKVAGIVVGYPYKSEFDLWQTRGREWNLLPHIEARMKADGVVCPGW